MSKFFIERPVFAWVVAILISMAGLASLLKLPISQYPDVAPPAISISGCYPGASAKTLQDVVVQTIEREMNALDGFIYMSSSCSASGTFSIDLTFKQGTDPNIAQVQVQNKLQQATPMLPAEVTAQGLTVAQFRVNFMLIVACYCKDGSLTEGDLGDVMAGQVKDAVSRVDGVGQVEVWGSKYAMRVWLDPERLAVYNLTPQDVVAAIQEQNVQVAAGQIGAAPAPKGARIYATVIAKNKMTTVDDFKKILLKTDNDGSQVRIQDVAEVELGSENYSVQSYLNGYPAVGLSLRLANGANLLATTDKVKETIDALKPYMPKGAEIAYLNENAPNVRASINAVVHTLIEAVVLVFAVMFLFLQRFKATLIPTFTIPVVLLGVFGVLNVAGFTLNVVVLFALTLAIGLLVDDAIVVVENVERIMETEGLDAKAATIKTMEQIQGALVGVGATISAVFLPTAFFGGSTGVIYRQFAIAIISSMLLSVFMALTFAPALCATMLTKSKDAKETKPFIFFRWFNGAFSWFTNKYTVCVEHIVRRRLRYMAVFLVIVGFVAWAYPKLPSAFLPSEDQGTIYTLVELPPNSTHERTQEVLDELVEYFVKNESDCVENTYAVNGFSFAGESQNSGMLFISMKPFSERMKPGRDVFSVVQRASERFAAINKATITPMVPPSMPELGNVSGLDFYLQDRAGLGHDKMLEIEAEFLGKAMESGFFTAAWPNALPDEPQYKIDIDDERARATSLSLSDVNATFAIAWGSAYVNDFLDRGRVKRVFVQGARNARASSADFEKWRVRNKNGELVPFSAFASGRWISGPPKLANYNGVSGVEFNAVPAPGVSSGAAMDKVAEIVKTLPPGVDLSFTGLSYEEKQSGSQSSALFGLAMVIVFLCLAALYESWTVPFAIALVMPFGVLGAVAGVMARDMMNDVFFQVGLLTVMGLSAKNAILIVEFAKQMVEKDGVPILKAVAEACKLRLRPILMTSAAFALGVLPMTKAVGASSLSQRSLGTCVFGGTVAATAFAIFFVPLFYVVVVRVFRGKKALQE